MAFACGARTGALTIRMPAAAEHVVEGGAVFAVAVADQEAHAVAGEVEAEVACLLGDPGSGGVGRAAGQPDAPVCVR